MADTNADFFKLTLTNTLDQTLDLSDLANYVAEESDGFGMPPLLRLRDASPNQHGEIDTGFQLLPRKLKFKLKARGASPAGLYARRAGSAGVLGGDCGAQVASALEDNTTHS